MRLIDYRSDTVTRPGPAMREAMLRAPVGDDVFGEDPSVNALQKMAARLFGMAEALFCPSGTMTNQIAIKAHTKPGEEVVCSEQAHVYVYEGGGMAFNSGVQARVVAGDRGRITAAQVTAVINPDDVHRPPTTLVCLEDTVNRGGGSCYDIGEIKKIHELCSARGLKLHLDGARLFNALCARGEKPADYGKLFDSISVCLSKGLGAPVGSLLLGSGPFIRQARRIRKVLGGGMRQAGILAAAGSYALQHHVERLREDHAHAARIASVLKAQDYIADMLPVETNILIFGVGGRYSAAALVERLKQDDILALAVSASQVRMVLHLDITPEMVEKTCQVLRAL
jgi:threonine aldolase